MSKHKQIMNLRLSEMIDALKTFDIPVLADEIAEDEETEFMKNSYHLFVYEKGDTRASADNRHLIQEIIIYYYSENRSDLDERMIDIIEKMSHVKQFNFVKVFNQRFKRKDTDNFLDRLSFVYNRTIPVGCQL